MTPTPDEPRSASDASDVADPTDERLSAALDGEAVDGEPVDRGLASPATAERARALAAARDVLATPPPPLDDVTRRRLLDSAGAAGRPARRRHSRWSMPVAAAALLVVVALGGWGLISLLDGASSTSNGSKDASSQGAGSLTTGPLPLASLGEVSTPARLLRVVKAALARQPSEARSTTPGSACRGTVKVPTDVTLEVLARATFHGSPAVVLVGREPPRTLVYVLASSDCRLLSAQFFKG